MRSAIYNRRAPGFTNLTGLGENFSDMSSWAQNYLSRGTQRSSFTPTTVDHQSAAQVLNNPQENPSPAGDIEMQEFNRSQPSSSEAADISIETGVQEDSAEATRRRYRPTWRQNTNEPSASFYAAEELEPLEQSSENFTSSQMKEADLNTATDMFEDFDAGPLALAGGMIDKMAFDSAASSAEARGTISGRVAAGNYTREGNDTSTGMIIGGTIGSLFDEILGPLGTIAGTAIGGAIGGAVSTTTDRRVNTTAGSAATDDPSLAF